MTPQTSFHEIVILHVQPKPLICNMQTTKVRLYTLLSLALMDHWEKVGYSTKPDM